MISSKEANKILERETIQKYNEEIKKYRENCFLKDWNKEWDGYISLPFLKNRLGIEAVKLNKKTLILVHPGWGIYKNEETRYDKEKYGDYEKEYFEPLIERIKKAKETVIVFTPEETLKETIDITGEDVLFVPTGNPPYICDDIFGTKEKEFVQFLSDSGVEEIEISGEWVGACFDNIESKFLRYNQFSDKKFRLKRGNVFPVRGEYDEDFLFEMKKEEEKRLEKIRDEINNWLDQTYTDYLLKLNLEEDTCPSKILKIVVNSFSDDFVLPALIFYECKGYGTEEVRKSLNFLQDNEILRIEKAADVYSKELTDRLDYGRLTGIKYFNKLSKEQLGLESDEIITPLIRREV